MLIALIRNETLKLIRRKRFAVVIGILTAVLIVFTYGQYRTMQHQRRRNWRMETQQRIAGLQNALRRGNLNESWARSMRAEVSRLQFYVDHDLDPMARTSPMFVRRFANVAGVLLLPLLIAVLGADIVSAESAEGTDKLLLTRPVRRWKILTAKMVTLAMFSTLTLLCGALLAWAISSTALPRRGWDVPTFTGFAMAGESVNLDNVKQLPLWRDTLIAYGLEWFALLAVAAIALMLSVLFRSSAAAIGTMLASLIGGTILRVLSPDWVTAKYLFVTALSLADYYTGEPPPYEGVTVRFCIILLTAWAIGALGVAYATFTRRDVFG